VLQALKTAPRRVSIRVGIKTSGAPRRGGDEYDRASSLPTGPPRESAGEPFLQVVRRSADERRELATRQEHHPVRAARAWPSKLGPAGKALAVGVAALATEAGLSWLQRRIGTEERSLPAVRDAGSASGGYLVGQSLEEVLVGAWEDSHGRVVARREVRSFVSTGPTGRRR
jgi:hypothetical protein